MINAIPSLTLDQLGEPEFQQFEEVELRLTDMQWNPARIKEIQEELDEEVRIYSVRLPAVDLRDEDKARLHSFKELVKQISRTVAPTIIVVHGHYIIEDRFAAQLRSMVDGIREGQRIAVENLPRYGPELRHGASQYMKFEMLPGMPQEVGLCLDTTHIYTHVPERHTQAVINWINDAVSLFNDRWEFRQRSRRPWRFALAPDLVHAHIADCRPVHCDIDGYSSWQRHLPLGQGVTDWRSVARTLKQVGYRGRVVLDYGNVPAETLLEGQDYWRTVAADD